MPAVKVNRKFAVPYNLAGVRPPVTSTSSPTTPSRRKDYAYMFDTVKNNGVAFSGLHNQVCLSNKGGDGIDTKTIAPYRSEYLQLGRRRRRQSDAPVLHDADHPWA